MNLVILMGRLTRDVELRHTQGGSVVGNFTLAVDRGMSKDKKQEAEAKGQATADFIRCICFGKTAELASNYLAKGLRVGVEGRIQTGSYINKDGQTVYTTDVIVSRLNMIDWANSTGGQGFDDGGDDFIPMEDTGMIPF